MKNEKPKSKKIKVGTVLDEEVVKIIKEHSYKENKTISEVIQEAVILYAAKDDQKLKESREAMERILNSPFHLSAKEVKEILDEDFFDQ
jgi:dihydroxyacetone kinase